MAKLRYIGRKVLGLKAGQAVSKDLRKRVPPGLGSKAATRDPHVEIDLTGKELTDEGFAAFANDLISCIQYRDEEHPNGIVRLTELVLKGNALTVASVKMLGTVVALSSDCLTQLDISDNQISVASREQREAWQAFLESFQGCFMLKKIDMASNPLGGEGFDVLARVYTQSDLDFIEPLADESSTNRADTDVIDVLSKGLDVVNLDENRKPSGHAALVERNNEAHQASLKVFGSQVDCQGAQPTEGSNHRSARGLQSVPYLVFSNSCTTNACAFHLWTIILSHRQPDNLLEFLPPGKSMAPPEQTHARNGVVYMPNEKLSALGRKLLELGNGIRMQTSDTEPEETEPGGFDDRFGEWEITKHRELCKRQEIEMERVKNRLLLDVLKTDGTKITDIWDIAFKMMRVARAILLDDGTRMKPLATIEDRNTMEPYLAKGYATIEYPTSKYLKDEYLKNGCLCPSPFAQQSENFLEDFPTIQETLDEHNRQSLIPCWEQTLHQDARNTTSRRVPGNRKDSIAGAKKPPTKNKDKSDIGRFGLPMNVWCRIIADAMGASEVLTVEQQMSVLRYASDWQAIKQELRISGGTEFEQIWKILGSMGCLTYAHH